MARRKGAAPETVSAKTDIVVAPAQPGAMVGGGLEGAERTNRETVRWLPSMRSPDGVINSVKPMADARGRDQAMNDGYVSGAVAIHRDSIVGTEYRLNATPNWRTLGVSEEWAEEWAEIAEARFHTIAESNNNWLDAQGVGTFTDIIRLAVASFVMTGEVLATSEWITDDSLRPLRTAVQLISPDRLSNPNGLSDTDTMRRGIERNARGKPIRGWIRNDHPGELWPTDKSFTWKGVRFHTGWGRWQLLHIAERRLPDQSRGIAEMVAVLKGTRMAKQFREITLQNAVVNATYAAAIESEMPSDAIVAAMGGGGEGHSAALGWYMDALAQFLSNANAIAIDGVKIPHLFPGTKMKLQPAGTPGGVGTDFEASLLRYIAAGLGVSYEELSKDYSKTNYSSARAGMLQTWRSMQTKKRIVADRMASSIYSNVIEEEISAGRLPLPPGKSRSWFYEPLVRDALCRATWIGAARGQIDEKKETDAAVLRVTHNLSTLEYECARVGLDWRDVLRQRAREKKMMTDLGLDPAPTDVSQTRGGSSGGGNADDEREDGDRE